MIELAKLFKPRVAMGLAIGLVGLGVLGIALNGGMKTIRGWPASLVFCIANLGLAVFCLGAANSERWLRAVLRDEKDADEALPALWTVGMISMGLAVAMALNGWHTA